MNDIVCIQIIRVGIVFTKDISTKLLYLKFNHCKKYSKIKALIII